jgi:uncharacterized repeat protein (TIGR01451 family)
MILFALELPLPIIQRSPQIMSKPPLKPNLGVGLCMLVISAIAQAQNPAEHLVTNVSAELVARAVDHGAPALELRTAERVVPGDVLIYTVEVRNAGRYAAESAMVVQPIPNHMMYVADSAVGPGVDVDYSVDGGRTFGQPEDLKLAGAAVRASAADYTHIRWRLRNRLKPNSTAYLRFRAQVK